GDDSDGVERGMSLRCLAPDHIVAAAGRRATRVAARARSPFLHTARVVHSDDQRSTGWRRTELTYAGVMRRPCRDPRSAPVQTSRAPNTRATIGSNSPHGDRIGPAAPGCPSFAPGCPPTPFAPAVPRRMAAFVAKSTTGAVPPDQRTPADTPPDPPPLAAPAPPRPPSPPLHVLPPPNPPGMPCCPAAPAPPAPAARATSALSTSDTPA